MKFSGLTSLAFTAGAVAQGTGPYRPAYYTTDGGLREHTIYQPRTAPSGIKLPVLIWANGACGLDGTAFESFLTQVASHGFFAIANGSPKGSGGGSNTASYLRSALEWVTSNAGKGNYAHVDASKVAVAGQSCGGIDAYEVQGDQRIATVGIFNSGQLDASASQRVATQIRKPIFYFLGGPSDIAYQNGERDYSLIPSSTPAWKGNINVGHYLTFGEANAGRAGTAGSRWLQWLLQGNTTAGTYFTGNGAAAEGWQVASKNLNAINVGNPPQSTTTSVGGQPTSTTSSASASTTTAVVSPDCVPMWGQCGGEGYTGATCCAQGTCKFSNQWYSQCL